MTDGAGSGVSSGWIAQNDLDVPKLPEEAASADYKALYESGGSKSRSPQIRDAGDHRENAEHGEIETARLP